MCLVGGVLEAGKLDFSGLKGQFDVKKVNFRGLIAKTGHYRPILATSNPIMAHFEGIYNENCALKHVGWILELRKFDFRGLEGGFDV